MGEINESINKKNSILLSRNQPVALVVGAAGFLGSHLVDHLLKKNIQVVGVDNLKTGKRENLHQASEEKNFHLIIESAEDLDVTLERLDYLFIIAGFDWDLGKVFGLIKKTKCRCLFVSSIELYERGHEQKDLKWYKSAEGELAKIASSFKLNARVLRLGPIFGPRMHFNVRDSMVRLIQQALSGNLQKDVTLEFSTRALYVSDAIDLIIRTMFAGSTSQKIFDGVNLSPIKVADVKQVLMDPVWYENRDFTFSPLPPWPTPNLDKTVKFLSWHPKGSVVAALKHTLSYFKDNEISVAEPDIESEVVEVKQEDHWDDEKRKDLELFRSGGEAEGEKKGKKKSLSSKTSRVLPKVYLLILVALVTYALIWPVFLLGWGIITFRSELNRGFENLQKGDLVSSLENINKADAGVAAIESIINSLEPIESLGVFTKELEAGERFVNLSKLSVSSARSSILGTQYLLQGLKATTGETSESPAEPFKSAQIELSLASQNLNRADAILQSNDFKEGLPDFITSRVKDLSGKVTLYKNLINQAQAISILLPSLVSLEGSKSYLLLLQNNMELRGAGGFIGSFAKVTFEGGKLKSLKVNDIYAIDGQLPMHVEPPKEIKEDLGQKDWFLRDSNWEPDFPTSARQAQWFYTKETQEKVDGLIALDVSAMEELLSVIGPLDLPDYKEKIGADNLFAKAISHAELSFFPGSQAKKSFLTALSNEVFNKIFFLPQNNWPGIIAGLNRSLEEKHISVYLNDPKLFSYIDTLGWTHALPRGSKENETQDFLSLVEANLGANKVNYYLDRNYKLDTVIGKDGEVAHKMRISYTNGSPSDAFPGGKYKNRMRVYLPSGSKLTKASWGESDITGTITSFADYGRTGYSLLLELLPKEQKTLVLEYSVPIKLDFKSGSANYRLDIFKQAGALKDPLQWTITYPLSYQLVSNQTKMVGPQEQTIVTDLSKDRSFEVEFKK